MHRISIRKSLVTALVALAAAACGSSALVGAQEAQAHHRPAWDFPNVMKALNTGIVAWQDYLGHCETVSVYGYETGEYSGQDSAFAFAYLNGCDVYFNADKSRNYWYPWFCSVMVHEIGHSAGFSHAEDTSDIMNGPGEIYWSKCLTRKQRRRFARRNEIIDYSISQWTKNAGPSGTGTDTGPVHADGRARERFEDALADGRIHAHRVATAQVP
jgi:hypothetical protein